jgi:type II secretory pathway pseudopilin PulG
MRNKRSGFSILELLVVIAVSMTFLAVAAVGYREVQLRARETAAIQHVQTLQKAQTQYYAVYRRYAPQIADLGTEGLIPEHLATGSLGGYVFELEGQEVAFKVIARPNPFETAGKRSFFTDETLVIRQTKDNRPAARNDPPV